VHDDDDPSHIMTVEAPPPSLPVRSDERGDISFVIREQIVLRGLHSSGGIGEVWRAYDQVLEREIALKRLQPEFGRDAAHRARFSREAKLTGQLDHPGIVPVYEYSGDQGGDCYYTMRFVRGRTFREIIAAFHQARIKDAGPLLCSRFLRLLGQFVSICNTIAFAHSRQVIHRDIKSDNVIVGDFGEVVVLDWGLAKRIEDDEILSSSSRPASESALMTAQGTKLGTPAYMAPEQALGEIDRIERRTDVYGLAAILYEILTGRPPFEGSVAHVLRAITEQSPPPPRSLVVDVPVELEEICLRGLAKRIDERQQSASALGLAVNGWMVALAEHKRIEQERERFFDLSSDLLALVDRQGNIGQCNAAWTSALGFSPDQLRSASFIALVLADDRSHAQSKLDAIWVGGGQLGFEVRMGTADGGYRWIDWSAKSMPDDVALYLVGRDITERKHTEQEVEGLLESAPDATCVIDDTGIIVRVNAQLERMFGHERTQLLGQRVEVLVPEHLRERHVDHVARFISKPTSRPMGSGLNLVGQRADKSLFSVEVSLSPVQTERGLLISCTLRDAEVRRRVERTMMAILEAAPDAMITVDRSQAIRLVNRQAEALFGYDRSELLGQPLDLLIPERDRAAHVGHVERFASNPIRRNMGTGQPLRGRHKDGHEFVIQVSLSPVETEDGLLISSAVRPINRD
jgi:PAS domain S-box-containing protein